MTENFEWAIIYVGENYRSHIFNAIMEWLTRLWHSCILNNMLLIQFYFWLGKVHNMLNVKVSSPNKNEYDPNFIQKYLHIEKI